MLIVLEVDGVRKELNMDGLDIHYHNWQREVLKLLEVVDLEDKSEYYEAKN